MKPESARLYVKRWDNGALSVYEEPTEGAFPYDCVECLETTGHQCLDHREPECTCYELHGMNGGHQPGCYFHGRKIPVAETIRVMPMDRQLGIGVPADALEAMGKRCKRCGVAFGAHIVNSSSLRSPARCPDDGGIFT